ncbi:MAG: OmpA family protein [Bacteroidota bacterium]|jgi:peptidoglycan-associated lipoprotein
MIKKLLGVLLILSVALNFGIAQDKAVKVPKSKTVKADKQFNIGQYYTASTLYKKAYTRFKKNEYKSVAAFKAGECARMMGNHLEAEDWYGKAVAAKYKAPIGVLRYADALKGNGKYDEAIAQYNAYKALNPEDNSVNAAIAATTQAQAWKDKPTRHRVDNMSALNTKYYEFAVCENPAVKNSLVFSSSREEANGKDRDKWYGEKFFDLFQAAMDNNGKWSIPTAIPGPANSEYSDGAACFDASGKVMYYTTCPNSRDKNTQCKIVMTTMTDGKWSDPIDLPFNSESYTCGHPCLSPDGNSMYFSSDMPGGQGGKDIWVSAWNGSNWGTPTNLGSNVNSSGDELFPTMGKNGKLYLASNGRSGMGGLDMFHASYEGGTWTEAANMKSPMNSSADDFGLIWNSESTGYFTSNRDGGKGMDDVYSFIVPPLKLNVGGRVYDTDTKESLEGAAVELFGSDGTSLSVQTGSDGMYRYELKANVKYKLSASFTGYLTKFHELSTVGLEEDEDFTKDFDFPLKSTSKPITVPEIFYDLDKSTLRAESKKALDGLIQTLNENPTITIKLTAHTDYRAEDAYNQKLSDRRAKSVMDYLIANGVPADRLTSEGKGETQAKSVENDEEYAPFKTGDVLTKEFIDALASEEDKEKAHQYNRRTEFEVTGTTYVPKN